MSDLVMWPPQTSFAFDLLIVTLIGLGLMVTSTLVICALMSSKEWHESSDYVVVILFVKMIITQQEGPVS